MGDTELFLGLAEGEEIKRLTGTMGEHEVVGGTRNKNKERATSFGSGVKRPLTASDSTHRRVLQPNSNMRDFYWNACHGSYEASHG